MSFRLFEDLEHTKAYENYRPTYPDSVFDVIVKYCRKKLTKELCLAIDVGCGSGQSTIPLAKFCQKVIGVDISDNQIIQATQMSERNVTFRVGPAEDLGFQGDKSVDLVTVAQAFHWMDAEKFYSEVTRILRPGGTLAIYGYGFCTLDNEKAQKLVSEFANVTRRICRCGEAQRRHIDNHYSEFDLPFENIIRNDDLYIEKNLAVKTFIGYMSSSSSYIDLCKKHPDSNLLKNLYESLKTIYTDEETKDEKQINVKWPVFMLLGSKSL